MKYGVKMGKEITPRKRNQNQRFHNFTMVGSVSMNLPSDN